MTYLANTRVAVLRGETLNALGDVVDSNGAPVVGYEDLPASLIETSKAVFDPSTGTRRTVRVVTCRLNPVVVIVEGDRIRDNQTGTIYAVSEWTRAPRALGTLSSLTLDLEDV